MEFINILHTVATYLTTGIYSYISEIIKSK